jgi:hypothetical protein
MSVTFVSGSDPDFSRHTEIAHHFFPGPHYLDWLNWFHQNFRPSTYVEIGVETGLSFAAPGPQTFAIGVDPALCIMHPLRAWSKLFKCTSDDFFNDPGPTAVFGQPTDLAFLDGLHTFDQTLRDFINIEPHLHANSIVLLHDIYPVIADTACRDRKTQLWIGDTWKVVPILRELRKDLNIFVIPTFPSGLCVITGFTKPSPIDFDSVVEKWMGVAVEDYIDSMSETLNVVDNSFTDVQALIPRLPVQ